MRFFFFSLLIAFPVTAMPHLPASVQKEELVKRSRKLQSLRLQSQKLIQNQEFKKVLELYERLEEKDRKDCEELWLDCILDQIECLVQLNYFDEALSSAQTIENEPLTTSQKFRKQLLQSKSLMSLKKVPESLELLLQTLQEHPFEDWPAKDRPFLFYARGASIDYYQQLKGDFNLLMDREDYESAYSKAKHVLEALDKGIYQFSQAHEEDSFLYHVAACEYALERLDLAEKRLTFLSTKEESPFKASSLFLLAKCLLEKGFYDPALKCCSNYLLEGPFQNEFEKGLVCLMEAKLYELKGDVLRAYDLYQKVNEEGAHPEIVHLKHIYLAQLDLKKHDIQAAQQKLSSCPMDRDQNPVIYLEGSYAWAQLYAEQHKWLASSEAFKAALGHKEAKKAHWWPSALYQYAFVNFQLAQAKLEHAASLKCYLELAEQKLKLLLSSTSSDEATGLLAQVYALRYHRLHDEQAKESLLTLFHQSQHAEEEVYQKMGFLALEVLRDLSEQLEVIDQLLACCHTSADQKNLLKKKIEILIHQNKKGHKEQILSALGNLCEHFDPLQSSEFEGFVDSLLTSLLKGGNDELAFTLLEHIKEQFIAYPLSAPSLYITYQKALMDSRRFSDPDELNRLYPEVVLNLESILKYSNNYQLKEQSLAFLGSLHFAKKAYPLAKKAYLQFLDDFPKSELTAEVLFWLAECYDLETHGEKTARLYRQKLFTQYSTSSFADQAYFYYYPFEAYQKGEERAIAHLEKMDECFGNSNYLIPAIYLRALNSKRKAENDSTLSFEKNRDIQKALLLFGQLADLFTQKKERGLIDAKALGYLTEIFLKSQLSHSEILLKLAESSQKNEREEYLAKAIHLNEQVLLEIDQCNLNQVSELSRQALFQLSLSLIRNQQLQAGQYYLTRLLEESKEGEQSYYISRAWYELSLIAYAGQDFEESLRCLNESEKRVDSLLAKEECLEIAIQKSLSFRALGQYDQAVLSLSKAINDKAKSPLKAKAMLFRAELYALQGREELAQKQLQEVALAGGSWGKMARNRLVAEYGLN